MEAWLLIMHPSVFIIPKAFKDETNINILLLIAMGKNIVEISREVFKSTSDINNRIAKMNDALGIDGEIKNRTQARLIAEAFRLKIID